MTLAAARPMISGLAVMFVILAAAGVGVRFYMGRSAEDRLRPDEDIAISALRGPLARNAALTCPAGYCALADAMPSPVFAIPIDRLAEDWANMMAEEPRVMQIAAEPDRRRLVWIQRSALFRFPDVITVEFVALAPERSSVALYSRSRYGRSDFGVNRERVLRWLWRLQQIAGAGN